MTKPKMITDPKIIGPGLWQSIHLLGKKSTDDLSKQKFIDYMYLLYDDFPCENCRNHIREYMNNHPFAPFENITNNNGKQIGMFKWSWMFHNAVNTRLRKPYLDWDTACEMYNINEEFIVPCTDCGKNNEEQIPYIDKTKIIQGYFLQKGVNENISKIYN